MTGIQRCTDRPLRVPFGITRCSLVASLVALLCPLGAATITIDVTTTADELDGTGAVSLREAIAEATADVGGNDMVVSVPAGVYSLTLNSGGSDAEYGDLDITGGAFGSVTIRGAGIGATIIDAGAIDDRAIDVDVTKPVVFEGFTVRNGTVVGAAGTAGSSGSYGGGGGVGKVAQGGGIRLVADVEATLRRIAVKGCSVTGGTGGAGGDATGSVSDPSAGEGGAGGDAYGGGIYIRHGGTTLTVADCSFTDNLAQGGAGGAAGQLIVSGAPADASSGDGGDGGEAIGGGAYLDLGSDSISMSECSFVSNHTVGGAAADAGGIDATATDSYAFGDGGDGGDAVGGGFVVEGSPSLLVEAQGLSISGNTVTAGSGGRTAAIALDASSPASVTLGLPGYGGDGEGGGAGFYCYAGSMRFASCSINNNNATSGSSGAVAAITETGYIGSGDSKPGRFAGDSHGGGLYFWSTGSTHVQFDGVEVSDNAVIGGSGSDAVPAVGSGSSTSVGGAGGDTEGAGVWLFYGFHDRLTYTGAGLSASGNSASPGAGGGGTGGGASGVDGIVAGADIFNEPTGWNTIQGITWSSKPSSSDPTYDDGEDFLLPGVRIELKTSGNDQVAWIYSESDASYSYSFKTSIDGTGSKLQFSIDDATPLSAGTDVQINGSGTAAISENLDTKSQVMIYSAGYEADPVLETLNLTISGRVSADVTSVAMGSTSVTPSGGSYTISVTLPYGSESIDLVTTGSGGAQTVRTITLAELTDGGI